MPSRLSLLCGKWSQWSEWGKDLKKEDITGCEDKVCRRLTTWQREETWRRWLGVITHKKKHDVQVLLHMILMQCPDSRMGGKGGVEDEEWWWWRKLHWLHIVKTWQQCPSVACLLSGAKAGFHFRSCYSRSGQVGLRSQMFTFLWSEFTNTE